MEKAKTIQFLFIEFLGKFNTDPSHKNQLKNRG